MKKILGLLAILSTFVQGEELKNGTFIGKGKGYKGEIKTEVIIKNNKISEINLLENNDTPIISDAAFREISKDIIEIQGLGVDMVAGASSSSTGVYRSIISALKSSGANINKLRKIKKEKLQEKPVINLTTDVLVVGGGGAGLSAASAAIEKGVNVTLIEKMAFLGGNTLIAGGAYNAVDPKRQSPMNIEDSNELFFKQTLKGGDNLGNPKLVKILTDNAYDSLEWLEEKGVEYKKTVFTVIGALHPRSHKPTAPVGTSYIQELNNYLTKNKANILLKTKANKLIINNGKVIGVIAENEKNILNITANGGVILATGGFGNNIEYRQKWNSKLTKEIRSTNTPAATGDGIFLGKSANANLIGMEHIQLLSLGDPNTGSLSGTVEINVEDRIFVNKSGKRFIAEDSRRDVLTNALFKEKDATLYIIVDSKVYPTMEHKNTFNETIGSMIASNKAVMGNTLEELAVKLNMDPKVLINTVNEYNIGLENKNDKFNRQIMGMKIDKGPFFAGARVPTVHHTMGGLEINEKTEVIDKKGNIIEGLYAAGEVTGGIHGTNRLGGNALPEITIFGRIAGENAAKNINK